MDNTYLSPLAQGIKPYVPGEQPRVPGLIKLNTNENPYGPSPLALQAAQEACADTLRLYPDPESTALREALAQHHGVPVESVFVGNGSDEVLALCFPAFFQQRGDLLCPDITYSFYPVYAALFSVPLCTIPLKPDFSVDINGYALPCAGILLPNPNAPTARAISKADIRALLESNRQAVVVIDEAYAAFSAYTAISLISEYANLLVVRTLSKSHALAGLRVGYAVGSASLIDGLNRVKNSFNSYPLDRIAQAAARAAILDEGWLEQTTAQVIHTRAYTVDMLGRHGFDVVPSSANFVFCRHPDIPGAQIMQALRERKILVRRFDAPRIAEYLRITIGTPEDMQALNAALDEILAS